MPLLTVFTSTFNRKRTLIRTCDSLRDQTCKDFQWLIIDDGSTDSTGQWIESLGPGRWLPGLDFDWMGRLEAADETCPQYRHYEVEVPFTDGEGELHIEYIHKSNGGLYTGYNVAYSVINTELCVCIDSDDFMPNDAVEIIKQTWNGLSLFRRQEVAGILGLDWNVSDKKPIGGRFRIDNQSVLVSNLHHKGDSKFVFRTSLMKDVCPQIGFEREKNFNPHYMQMQVLDKYRMWTVNKNLCWVEYQTGTDSMSQQIYRQYVDSPRSFAKMRLQEMALEHNTLISRFRSAIHYVSSCLIARDRDWFRKSGRKTLTALAAPFGFIVYCLIILKTR